MIDLGSIDTEKFLMKGAQQPTRYANKLSAWEMDSLTALCNTFLPAMEPPNSTLDESVAQFYRTSPSTIGTPDYLGGLISRRLGHHVFLVRSMLLLLSTRIGTFIMGGFLSLSPRFPFLHRFSQLPLEKRQRIVRSWATSWFKYFRMAFVGAKLLVTFSFFTQVDEKGDNPTWKGIGYDGPDPHFKSNRPNTLNHQVDYLVPRPIQGPNTKGQDQPNAFNVKEDLYGPLYRAVISVQRTRPKEILAESLRHAGFHVSVKRKKKQEQPVMSIRCDAVVVGSGSGGGVVAGVLASAGYKVLVLEKGQYYARSNLSLLEGPTLDQMYEGAGMLTTRDMGIVILAGSTVGGGSTINWAASIRPPEHRMREWAHVHELEIFESPLFKEALDVVCEKMEVQQECPKEGLNNMVLRKGCLELGYPVENVPRNAPADHYCGWCSLGCKDGKKKGVSETWLKDLVDSGNGVILSGCEVIKVLHKRKNNGKGRDIATGVAFKLDGESQPCLIEAKATIVSCGALNTPTLLKKSGLKNSNIGKNLHLHPVVMAWGCFPEGDESGKSYEGPIMSAMSTITADHTNKSGSNYEAIIQTPSMHPGMFAVVMPWISGPDYKHRMARFSRTAHIFTLVRDLGSGTIVSSPNPFDVTYEMDPIDEAKLKKGIERLLRILAAAGAEEVGTHQFSGTSINLKKVSSDEFESFVKRESSKAIKPRSTTIASAHQMGSCRMGVDPKNSVVNQRGETWEVEGLYLADSSVFPTALGVNPMVTIQATAYCTAQSIVEYLKRKKT